MKQVAGIIVLAALAAVVAGGPFAVAHGMEHASDCFLSTSLPCAVLGSIVQHLDALQRTLTAAPVLLAAVLLLAAFALFTFAPPVPTGRGSVFPLRRIAFADIAVRRPVLRWHARLTHSPTFA
jgi:hypothetical protein